MLPRKTSMRSPVPSQSGGLLHLRQSSSHAERLSGSPTATVAAPVDLADLIGLASAADQASCAVHNLAAIVDRDRTRDAWNSAHMSFLHARCSARRRQEARARCALAKMLPALEELLDMARQVDKWPNHLAAGERTAVALRAALEDPG
jgi:hypothetical protein